MKKREINWPLLREACAVIDGIPVSRFNLNAVCVNTQSMSNQTNPQHCGTVGCVMGWLGMHPDFKARGLGFTRGEYPMLTLDGCAMDYATIGAKVFGMTETQAENLFSPVNCSSLDNKTEFYSAEDSRKVFRNRIRKFFRRNGQPCAW
jgi:hypothetical protein